MIDFKHKEYVTSSTMIVLSIAILAGCLAFMLFVPAPSVAGAAHGRSLSQRRTEQDITRSRQSAAALEHASAPLVWHGDVQTVTSRVLERLTDWSNAQNVKLTAFRPLRTQMLTGLLEAPFTTHLTGGYPAVRKVIAMIDAPGSKLALTSIQIASSDESSNLVAATVSVSAFILQDTAPQVGAEGAASGA